MKVVVNSLFIVMLMALFPAMAGAQQLFGDEENCLMCHKHRRMARIDEKGERRNYYLREHAFGASIHGKVPCRGCHTSIKELPHKDVKPVDCTVECHLKAPFSRERFSHKWAVKLFKESVHAPKPDEPEWAVKSKPDCKYCHYEPSYKRPPGLPSQAYERCKNCHQEEEVARALEHVTHRLRVKTSRSPLEIVELCSKNCHEDRSLMEKFKVNPKAPVAVETYKETLHYRVNQFGFGKGADCIDCHAPLTFHDIRKSTDPQSHLYKDVRYKACRQEGCHPEATQKIAAIDTHIAKGKGLNPALHYAELVMLAITVGTLIALISLTTLESFARWRNRDARILRWKRRPQPLPVEEIKGVISEVKTEVKDDGKK